MCPGRRASTMVWLRMLDIKFVSSIRCGVSGFGGRTLVHLTPDTPHLALRIGVCSLLSCIRAEFG
jgi:hypothetical protein